MARKSIDLTYPTPTEWTATALSDFDHFLIDHANCERKASALAMSFVVRYPDKVKIIPALIALAKEELEHFDEAYQLMQKRGLELSKDEQDPYVNELLKHARHGRHERFIDRMLIASVVESRGAERFGLIAKAHPEAEIRGFYDRLYKAELKHAHLFAQLLLEYVDEAAVYSRLQELNTIEGEIVQRLPWRPALH
jgi:tRNA 2-(methylsulfanyl)-N6-isopentenyladenosine37 hydroxylase